MEHHDKVLRPSRALSRQMLCAGLFLLVACGVKDDREAKARSAVADAAGAESEGALSLTAFAKTDGFTQTVSGTEMYVLEWKAQFLATKDTRVPMPVAKGTLLERTGNATLRTTEKGWRIEDLRVATSQVICDSEPPTGPTLTPAEFKGRWRKEPIEGGQMLSDALAIDVSSRGQLRLTEFSINTTGTFRDVTFDRGLLCGTYVIAVDNEHRFRFRIRSVSANKFEYSDERGVERFSRVPSPFVGNWTGYQVLYGQASGPEQLTEQSPSFEFSIALDKGAYVVSILRGDYRETWKGNEVNGKILAEGAEKDFYKFQIPTIEVLANGNLKFTSGADDAILKRKQ